MSDGQVNATRVHVTRLRLSDFRNYAGATLTTDPRHVVLTGANGSGKTNLLEALSFLSPGRGMRRATLTQVGRTGAAGEDRSPVPWAVHVRAEGQVGPVEIGTGLQAGASEAAPARRVQINGAAARGSDALLEHLRVTWLTPALDGLFTGPGSDRRRFLDRMVLAIDPGHARRVADYERALTGRNRMLGEGVTDPAWLDAQEAQIAEIGTAVAAARAECVGLLQAMMDEADIADSPFPRAETRLEGTLDDALRTLRVGDAEAAFIVMLREGRGRDRAAGRTLDGPHRTNLAVRHAPKAMDAASCSTGEQKALLTGLVLAHARLVARLTGAAPLLLLDEIAAHLDGARRAALFDIIDALGSQAWMTGTDPELFDALGARAQRFHVDDGTVRAS